MFRFLVSLQKMPILFSVVASNELLRVFTNMFSRFKYKHWRLWSVISALIFLAFAIEGSCYPGEKFGQLSFDF